MRNWSPIIRSSIGELFTTWRQHPAESTAYRLAKHDRKLDIKTAGKEGDTRIIQTALIFRLIIVRIFLTLLISG